MYTAHEKKKINHALELVLQDLKFMSSPKMAALLRYIVLQTLDGNSLRIKAYTIAVEAMGKPETFNPQRDTSVRVMGKRLRDALTNYYNRTTGHEVVLMLKPGNYIPEFVILANYSDSELKEITKGVGLR